MFFPRRFEKYCCHQCKISDLDVYKRIMTHKLWALLSEGDLTWEYDLDLIIIFTPGKWKSIKHKNHSW